MRWLPHTRPLLPTRTRWSKGIRNRRSSRLDGFRRCLLIIFAFTGRALAAPARNCSVDSSDLMCRLGSVLHALYVVAVVLGILLLAVVLLAVRLYCRNKAGRSGVL